MHPPPPGYRYLGWRVPGTILPPITPGTLKLPLDGSRWANASGDSFNIKYYCAEESYPECLHFFSPIKDPVPCPHPVPSDMVVLGKGRGGNCMEMGLYFYARHRDKWIPGDGNSPLQYAIKKEDWNEEIHSHFLPPTNTLPLEFIL